MLYHISDLLPEYKLIDNLGSAIIYYQLIDDGYMIYASSSKIILTTKLYEDTLYKYRSVRGSFGSPILFKKDEETITMSNIELYELLDLRYKKYLRLKKLERIITD